VTRIKDWIVALGVLALGRLLRRPSPDGVRIVPPGEPDRRGENWVLALFGLTFLLSVAFVVFYAIDSLPRHTQLFGTALGGAFVSLGVAAILIAKRLIVTEEIEEEYPEPEFPDEQEKIVRTAEESTSRMTRKKLLLGTGGAAVGALGIAVATPAVSFGPVFDMGPFYEANWKRGRRLVDEQGKPYRADDIEEQTFYTAFPEHQDKESFGSPVIVVRLDPAQLRLPPERRGWAPDGIVAYSKICTHAGCAISLYRTPKFAPVQAKPALVCPCHYSTFDPATGGLVLFGPAGRRLPQLPLEVDGGGFLRAKANFSEPVGPSWWGVRMGEARA
jgi:ubiquinol-cytochrome c reductase iron-sulfur subunit